MQQEIAEELERERKRNRKELSALQHTNVTILRQRDEAQRVVLHLRALISGQTHHMEHIVRTLGKSPELAEYLENGYDDEDDLQDIAEEEKTGENDPAFDSRASSRAHRQSRQLNGEELSPDSETRPRNKRYSTSSIIDVADRHLKDKTDAIAHIIRNISEQCAAAVEGLQLAHDAEVEAEEQAMHKLRGHRSNTRLSTRGSDDGHSNLGSDNGDDSHLHPGSGRNSSVPPTPDLIHHRSSTAMSIASVTTTPERSSQQYNIGGITDIPTKIVEDSDEEVENRSDNGIVTEMNAKPSPRMIHRPAGARLSALGGR